MSRHGTHVASVIFRRHDGPVPGLASGCRGLIVPIFSDGEGHLSQLDLARTIDQAVEVGAHVINVNRGAVTWHPKPGRTGGSGPHEPRIMGRPTHRHRPVSPPRWRSPQWGALVPFTVRRIDHDQAHS